MQTILCKDLVEIMRWYAPAHHTSLMRFCLNLGWPRSAERMTAFG